MAEEHQAEDRDASAAGAQALGRVADPDGFDKPGFSRGRLRVEVPATWLLEPCELELTAPQRIVCARCDGGGCDGCNRSGVFLLANDVRARALRAHLPGGTATGVVLRVASPFGPTGAVDQLLVEVVAGDQTPTAFTVRRKMAVPWTNVVTTMATTPAQKSLSARPSSKRPSSVLAARGRIPLGRMVLVIVAVLLAMLALVRFH